MICLKTGHRHVHSIHPTLHFQSLQSTFLNHQLVAELELQTLDVGSLSQRREILERFSSVYLLPR